MLTDYVIFCCYFQQKFEGLSQDACGLPLQEAHWVLDQREGGCHEGELDHRGGGEEDRDGTDRGGYHPGRERAHAGEEHPRVEGVGASFRAGSCKPVEVASVK